MIPPPPDEIRPIAEWYAKYCDEIAAVQRATRRLLWYLRDIGPVITPHGTVHAANVAVRRSALRVVADGKDRTDTIMEDD